MKSVALVLALLSLGCSGIPLYSSELEALANRGLGVTVAEVNSLYATGRLYRATRASVTKVIPLGLDVSDLLMTFDIKETECVKASRQNPQTCAFRPGLFVPTLSCSSRVRASATSTQVVSLKCGRDLSSSSSESSEEMWSRQGRSFFNVPLNNRAAPPPVQPGGSAHSRAGEAPPFANSLE